MGKKEQAIKIVTLRPDALDSEAIVKVKELYSTKEATTGILSAVRDVVLQQVQIETLEKELDELRSKYDNLAHSVEVFVGRDQQQKDQIEFWNQDLNE